MPGFHKFLKVVTNKPTQLGFDLVKMGFDLVKL